MFVLLALLTMFPQLALWLPNHMTQATEGSRFHNDKLTLLFQRLSLRLLKACRKASR